MPANHPLRPIRGWVNDALAKMDATFSAMYEADSKGWRPSIAPEKLMRAMLLQVLYSVRSQRQLVEQIQYNLLFHWFVGLPIEDTVWNHSVSSNNRDRLIEHQAVLQLFSATVEIAHQRGLLSGEHFSVDGTQLQAWASQKSVRRKDGCDDDRGIEQLQHRLVLDQSIPVLSEDRVIAHPVLNGEVNDPAQQQVVLNMRHQLPLAADAVQHLQQHRGHQLHRRDVVPSALDVGLLNSRKRRVHLRQRIVEPHANRTQRVLVRHEVLESDILRQRFAIVVSTSHRRLTSGSSTRAPSPLGGRAPIGYSTTR